MIKLFLDKSLVAFKVGRKSRCCHPCARMIAGTYTYEFIARMVCALWLYLLTHLKTAIVHVSC
jgi:hypothetical protein